MKFNRSPIGQALYLLGPSLPLLFVASNSYAVQMSVTNGTSQIATTGGSYSNASAAAPALDVANTGSSISGTDLYLSNGAFTGSIARVQNGGTITLNGNTQIVASSATQNVSPIVLATGSGSKFKMSGGLIDGSTLSQNLLQSLNGGSVTLDGGITLKNMQMLLGANSSLTLDHATWEQNYVSGSAIKTTGGTLTIKDSILTSKSTSDSVLRIEGNTEFNVSDTTIVSGSYTPINVGGTSTAGRSIGSFTNVAVSTSSNYTVNLQNAEVSMTDFVLTNTSPYSNPSVIFGINANTKTDLTLNRGTINSAGVGIWGLGAKLTASNIDINAVSYALDAWSSDEGNVVTIDHVNAMTSGVNTAAVRLAPATGSKSLEFTATDSTFKTTDFNSHGLLAYGTLNGSIPVTGSLTNVDITTQGGGSSGIYVLNNGDVTAENITINTTGASANAVTTNNGAVVKISNSSGNTTGIDSHLFRMSGSDNAYTNNLNITNGSFAATNGASFVAAGGTNNITLTNTKLISGYNRLMDVAGANATPTASQTAVVNLLVDHSEINGAATLAEDSISNITLNNGSLWHLQTDINGNLASTLSSLQNNQSTIAFSAPTGNPASVNSYKTLTVNGNYSGANGTIILNTYLGSDDSPSDLLHVKGDTSGNTVLKIINSGGLGAEASKTGIKVVDVDGNSAAGAFSLFGNKVSVLQGIYSYDYNLCQAGTTCQVSGIQDAGDWYLTSAKSGTPAIRPDSGTYINNLHAVNNMFMMTMHDRVGEQRYTNELKGEVENPTSTWLRLEQSHFKASSGNGEVDSKTDTYAMLLGGDVASWSDDEENRYHLGLMAGYGNAKTDQYSYGNGDRANGKTTGYSVGIYGSWFQKDIAQEGWYVDAWAQYGWFNSEVNTDAVNKQTYDSSGFSASLETGYAWKAWENEDKKFFIEPQFQVVWQGVTMDGVNVDNTSIEGKDSGNVLLRLGSRFYLEVNDKKEPPPHKIQPFVEVNWLHNTSDYAINFDYAGQSTQSQGFDGNKDLGELKIGFEAQSDKNLSFYGHVGQQWGSSGFARTAAQLAVKYTY